MAGIISPATACELCLPPRAHLTRYTRQVQHAAVMSPLVEGSISGAMAERLEDGDDTAGDAVDAAAIWEV